jgi:geranylgeranyl diphosphate synthase type I
MTPDFQPYLASLEQELRSIITPSTAVVAPLYGMMAYHLGWLDEHLRPVEAYHGKRLRPLLCLLSCQAAGGDWRLALPAAAALELVHNFSLIHDDIEDNSPTRRGRSTVWTLWGLAQGVNVGDAMLVIARGALTRLLELGVPPSRVLVAMKTLDRTCLRLCEGQYLDMAYEGRLDLSEEAYIEMISAKTAALIAASAELGALVAGAGSDITHYHQYGHSMGLAFQMIDDILGIWGDAEATGKPTATDIRDRKMTLPVIHALRDGAQGSKLAELYGRENQINDVNLIVEILDHTQARSHVEHIAKEQQAAALAALDAACPQPPAAQCLRDLAMSVITRRD